MNIVMEPPMYNDEYMVQRVVIIDDISGIQWSGEVRSRGLCNQDIGINDIIDLVKDSIVDARKGVNLTKVIKMGETRVKVSLRKTSGFINASKIELYILNQDNEALTIKLTPWI